MFFAIFFRMYPAYLPITDQWAQNSVDAHYQNQIRAQVDSQYPNLPDANKNKIVQDEFNNFLKNNKQGYEQQIAATSKQFKEHLPKHIYSDFCFKKDEIIV